MNNVVYDLFTGQVRGVDRDPLPAERSIEIPYPIQLTKTVEEQTGVWVQKVNEQGEPIYKKDVTTDELGQETYTETTESREETEWEEITHTYNIQTGETEEDSTDEEGNPIKITAPVYEEIHPVERRPVAWIDYDPVRIPEVLLRTYTLEQNPLLFTKEEVETAIANTTPVKSPSEVRDERLDLVEGAVNVFMDML